MDLAIHSLFLNKSFCEKSILLELKNIYPNIDFKLNRVYLGSEWCSKLICLHEDLLEKYNITLVTPAAVTNNEIAHISKILNKLSEYKNIEVVVNDWGLLHFIEQNYDIPIIIGRMLSKNKRDNRVKLDNLSDIEQQVLSYLAFNDPDWIDFFKKHNVQAVEIDFIPLERNLLIKNGIDIHIKYPLQLVSYGRVCFYSNLKGENFTINNDCSKQCEQTYLENNQVFLFGKCLLQTTNIYGEIYKFSRLVWQYYPKKI